MAGSIKLWNHVVDYGPHRFFSSDPVVVRFWHNYMNNQYIKVTRKTRIYYRSKFFNYPLRPLNALWNLGLVRSFKAILSYIKSILWKRKEDGSIQNWFINRFGYTLFEIFFKTYTEKLWGIPCNLIDSNWAAQRIQTLTLASLIRSALTMNRGNKHKTLVDEFVYPCKGNQQFYDQLSSSIEQFTKNQIRINSKVKKVLVENKKVIGVELINGEVISAEWIVSSMPITSLIQGMNEVPSNIKKASSKLKFRNTILVYLHIDSDNLFPDQWLYIHDSNVLHGRVTNFSNWSKEANPKDGTSVLCLEYWCFKEDEIWSKPENELIEIAKREIYAVGLMKDSKVLAGRMIRIPNCYPIYERGYQDNLSIVSRFLDEIVGLVPIGRYGSFKYNNQDHSLLMGIICAESISDGHKPNLWDINTDSKYQELGNINKLYVNKTNNLD